MFGAGIYALCGTNQSVFLTIQLTGNNTITGDYGIYVDAQQGGTLGANASLNITGDGSLTVTGTVSYGLYVQSGTGDASLTIENASVDATSSVSYYSYAGVCVGSSDSATAPALSLAVNGGSLTASGGRIQFYVGAHGATSATTSLSVTNNAIVDARNSGISATGVNITPKLNIGSAGSTGGIVFDGTEGTVYGDVTLGEPLTVGEGETLTIPQGSTLNTNGNLVNNGTIVNEGGTLNGEPGGTIVTVSAPAITTESLPDGMVDQPYTATLEATSNNITWSVTEGALPEGLTLNESTGAITGTPTADGRFPVTVTATNSVGSASKEYTLNIKLAFVPVAGLKLSSESLTLQEKDSDTLTATVEPADATNKSVTWESSDTDIATVDDDGTVTAVSAGSAMITATAADGSGASASCEVTVTHGDMVQTPKKDATCTADGTEGYWTCGICGKHFKDEGGAVPTTPEENAIPKTGHAWGEAVYTWSDDGKTCTATRACNNDSSHTESAEATVTSEQTKAPSCTDPGETTYTATVEFDGKIYTEKKDVADIPTIDHKLTKIEAKAATCTDPGNIEYWTCSICSKVFADADGKKEITLGSAAIPATGHSYGDDGHCTVCGAVESDFIPEIIAGVNATWHKGSGKDLSFTSNAAYDDFLKVLVDGEELDASNYAVEPGSTVVSLKASYLETLSAGKHELGIVSDTGTAKTEFTVVADEQQASSSDATDNDSNNEDLLASTRDGSTPLIAVLSFIALISAAFVAGTLRRSRLK